MDPNADLAPFMERFSEIVNNEWEIRYNKKFNRFLKKAHLRYPDADLDETIYDPARKNWTRPPLSACQHATGLTKARTS